MRAEKVFTPKAPRRQGENREEISCVNPLQAFTVGGTNDGPRLVAFDKKTGAELGSVDLPGAPIGTPMTYLLDGKQTIALTVAGNPPELVALSLP